MIRDGSQQSPSADLASGSVRPVTGTLYVVGTHIGNPEDVSLRALRVLSQVSVIAAEHPAVTQRLLSHHGITNTITSYGPTNLGEKVSILLSRLRRGQDIALVVDSGMPVIHDPGQLLVSEAGQRGIPIVVVPGASIVTAALALSGCVGDRFQFAGQMPATPRAQARLLSPLLACPDSALFFCPVDALPSILGILSALAPSRPITVAADVTTPGEVVLQGTAPDLLDRIGSVSQEAELTVVVHSNSRTGKRRQSAEKRATRRRDGG